MAVVGSFRITCKQLNSTVSSTIQDAKGLLALTSEVMHEVLVGEAVVPCVNGRYHFWDTWEIFDTLLRVGYITSIMTKGLVTNGGIHRLRKGNRRRRLD